MADGKSKGPREWAWTQVEPAVVWLADRVPGRGKTVGAIFFLIAAGTGAGSFVGWGRVWDAIDNIARGSEVAPLAYCVAIFSPDTAGPKSAAQIGRLLNSAIVRAIDEAPANLRMVTTVPQFLPQANTPSSREFLRQSLIQRFDQLYQRRRCRLFVVATGSAVREVRASFMSWRDSLVTRGRDAPFLVATTVSDPGIASADSGVFRYFVPAAQEAEFMVSAMVAGQVRGGVGIFYVNRTRDRDDDAYGREARDRFVDEFDRANLALEHRAYSVLASGEDAAERVNEFLAEEWAQDGAAYVVGYGEMFRRTVKELAERDYSGLIATSVLGTAPGWREGWPAGTSILTVASRSQATGVSEENVVYVFARRAVEKAIECAATTNTATIPACWIKPNVRDELLGVQPQLDGDVKVDLRFIRITIEP